MKRIVKCVYAIILSLVIAIFYAGYMQIIYRMGLSNFVTEVLRFTGFTVLLGIVYQCAEYAQQWIDNNICNSKTNKEEKS